MRGPILFSPGPVMVDDKVKYAQLHHEICHRGTEFMEMFKDTQSKINELFKADGSYYSVIISGSGTASNETVISSIFDKDDAVLLISNGVFGERLEEIINNYKVPMIKPGLEWAEYPDLNIIERVLQENQSVKVVAMVYHETSTGMINPVHEVGQLCRKYNKILFVDTVSAAAGQDIDVVRDNIDICTSVGGKCLGAYPGSAFICAKESILKNIRMDQCKSVYLNLAKHYKMAKNCLQTPNTPNVTAFFALNEALTQLLDEGIENRIQRYKECAGIIRNGLRDMGLKMLLNEKYMSNTVTSVFLPEGIKLDDFVSKMENEGYVIYAGKGKYYEMNMFQIANMGKIYPSDCYKFLEVLKRNIPSEISQKTA